MSEPGWYADPLGGPGVRYWNGQDWDGAPRVEDIPDDDQHREKRPNTRLLITALVGLVGLMGGILLTLLWPKGESAEPPAPTPAAAPTTTTTSTPSGAELAESAAATVRASMQRDLDNDPDLGKLGLKVVEVNLVNKAGNEYKGIATVKTRDGATHEVPVDVTADESNVLWETPPGAFVFAVEEPPPPSPRQQLPAPPPVLDPYDENFRVCPSGLTGVASENTSCAFADNVRRAWYSSLGAVSVTAYSPVTRMEYTMRCLPTATTVWPNAKRCAGENALGAALIVYIA